MVRRKKVDFILLSVQATIGMLRFGFRLWEPFAPPAKQQKLRALREEMAAIEQDKNHLLRNMDGASGEEIMDMVDAFQARYGGQPSPEMQAFREESRAKIRAVRKESADLKAIIDAQGNDTEDALRELRGYLSEHPTSDGAYTYLGIVHQKRCEWNESIAAFTQAERLADPETPIKVSQLRIADVLLEKGDFEAAIAQYQHLINLSPTNEPSLACLAYLRMGNALLALGQKKEARAAWKNAIRHDFANIVGKEARQKLKENP